QYMETTNMNQFIAALKIFHFPNIILLQLDITIKYIFFFGNFLNQLLAAVEARAVGGNIQLSTGSNLISLISIKSFTYGEKLDMVMEARGYTGQYYRVKQPLKTKDFLVSIAYLLFFGGLLYLGRN
ncbi:energy-coupling factor transporter transmembrane component T, partial [Enterococcus faecalis]